MSCVSPPELEDSRILSYLDGKGIDSIADHLARCPHCRKKADQLARLHDRLTARLYRVTCPSSVVLGEYHLGLLSTEQMVEVAQHVRECPHCKREVAQLRDYLRELAPGTGLLDRMKVLIARLVGSGPGEGQSSPAFAGIRGEEEGPSVYQVDGIQIAIEIQDDAEQPSLKVVLGLVTGIESTGLNVTLQQAGQIVATTLVDDAGNFVIPHLASGRYQLILTRPEMEIHVQALEF